MSVVVHEVWARVVWAAIDLAELGGLPRDRLFAGLPFDAASVRRLKRVPWSDYCALVENISALAGDGLEDLLEAGYHNVFPEVRLAMGALVDSKPLLRFITTIANPIAFPPVEHRFEDLGGRHVRITARLRPGARPCEAWFRGSIGAVRGIPRHLDMPPAEVTAQITPDSGIYDVVLPPDRTIVGRVRNRVGPVVRFVLGRESDGTPIAASFGEVGHDPFETHVQAAVLRWKLTPRQVRLLRWIANGETDAEIACHLGITEQTAGALIDQLLHKTGLTSRTQLIDELWHAD